MRHRFMAEVLPPAGTRDQPIVRDERVAVANSGLVSRVADDSGASGRKGYSMMTGCSVRRAFGKTAGAAWLIAKRKTNTLGMVHRQQ
jgi:hypothetical protein